MSKTQSSISRKITLSMFFSLFSYILVINIIILLFISYFHVFNIEKEINQVQNNLVFDLENVSSTIPAYFTISVLEASDDSPIFNFLFRSSSLDNAIYRKISSSNWLPFAIFTSMDSLSYEVVLQKNNQFIQFDYSLTNDIHHFWSLFRWIILFEFVILISSLFKFRKKVKISLDPISQLSSSTKSLQKDVSQLAVSANSKQLQSIADAIEKVDAQTLNNPLAIDSSQKELQQVTLAINEMLERINQTVSSQTQFVSDASHELRTPIAIIQGYINLLDRWGKNDPTTLQESIDAIKSETDNMKTLVEHLLFLARGDSETIQLNPETFDGSKLVEETIHEMQFIDATRKFNITNTSSVNITADKQLFKQALRILLDNSMKYSKEDTVIKVSCNVTKEYCSLSITHQGVGIQPENIDRIFDRFYRDQAARSNQIKGSGLGLAIAKWIVERHGGYIEIISREHVGTKVTLYFPLPNSSTKKEKS